MVSCLLIDTLSIQHLQAGQENGELRSFESHIWWAREEIGPGLSVTLGRVGVLRQTNIDHTNDPRCQSISSARRQLMYKSGKALAICKTSVTVRHRTV